MYSLVIVNNEEIKKEKGVNKNVIKMIRHEEYVYVFFSKNLISTGNRLVSSAINGKFDEC